MALLSAKWTAKTGPAQPDSGKNKNPSRDTRGGVFKEFGDDLRSRRSHRHQAPTA
jgi:hypothetical protein